MQREEGSPSGSDQSAHHEMRAISGKCTLRALQVGYRQEGKGSMAALALAYLIGAVCVMVGVVSSAGFAVAIALALAAFASFAWVTK